MEIVSLFSGIGGFERGLDYAGINYETVFASEIDESARRTYLSNYSPSIFAGDITQIKEEDIPSHDFLVAGFPCQAFSIAGRRKGFEDARGTLFFDVLRILKYHKPKFFLLENVKNLVNHDNSNTIRVILECLKELREYAIDFAVINACEAGAPQNRERTYIIGIKNNKIEPYLEDKRNSKINQLKQKLNKEGYPSFNFFESLSYRNNQIYIKDIIESKVDERFYFSSEKIKRFLETTPIEYPNDLCAKIVKLFDLPRDVHNDMERQRRVYSINGISPTVLARADTTKILLKNKDGSRRIRKFTPKENFRIQGYDDAFISNILKKSGNSNTQLYKQAGNAVSPLVIEGIIRHLIDWEKTKDDNTPLRMIDLFCGLGGFRIAFEENGAKCVFSSDIDKAARETYKLNFNETPSGDITKIEAESIQDFDILCAGFPCQPFSLAGKRMGFEDTRGTLFFDVLRILNAKTPKAFLLENVAGLTNHDNGKTLKVILESLDSAGYFTSYRLLNAKDYGVPQNRNRWYCVGIRKNESSELEFSNYNFFPEPCELSYSIDDIVTESYSNDYKSSEIAIRNINAHLSQIEKDTIKQGHIVLANNIRPSHTSFASKGISPCLTAKMGTGGNNVPIVVNQMRKLTEQECLRIMGFPTWYKIKKNCAQSYKQIGNSVVVPILTEIARNMVLFLRERESI